MILSFNWMKLRNLNNLFVYFLLNILILKPLIIKIPCVFKKRDIQFLQIIRLDDKISPYRGREKVGKKSRSKK